MESSPISVDIAFLNNVCQNVIVTVATKQGSAGEQPDACRELHTVSGDGRLFRRHLLLIIPVMLLAGKLRGFGGRAPNVTSFLNPYPMRIVTLIL